MNILDICKDDKKKDKAKSNLRKFGYGGFDDIYEIFDNGERFIGAKCGSFYHTCHVESSDIIILLVSLENEKEIQPYVKEFWY